MLKTMKREATSLAITILIIFASNRIADVFGDEEFCQELDKLSINCAGNAQVCQRIVSKTYDDYKNKCTAKCMLESMGILVDTKIDLSLMYHSHEATCEKSRLKEINAISQRCSEQEGPGPDVWAKDKCLAVENIFKCIIKKRLDAKIKPCT